MVAVAIRGFSRAVGKDNTTVASKTKSVNECHTRNKDEDSLSTILKPGNGIVLAFAGLQASFCGHVGIQELALIIGDGAPIGPIDIATLVCIIGNG